MIRLFLDASIVFTAAYSTTGAARELFRLALRGQVQFVTSRFALEEAERNLASKAAPEIVAAYRLLIEIVDPEIIPEPTREEVLGAATYTAMKDAPIVAAAINASPDYLVTFDRKYLIDPSEVAERSGLAVVLPETALQAVREKLSTGEDEGDDPAAAS